MSSYKQQYSSLIAGRLNTAPENIFFYWKGRVALYTALKSIGVKENDEVILPAFTCVVVPNAIKYLNATPIYVDINSKTYNTTLEHIKQKITKNTKVVIIQNTFGLSSEVELIQKYCTERNIVTIEDCTHGFGGTYNNKPNGSYSDFAFYSTQWNKPFSTGVGGFLMVNNSSYLNKIKDLEKQLTLPSFKDRLVLKALIFTRENILTSGNYWRMIKLYRWLSKYKIVVGSSSPEELASSTMPNKYNVASSKVQFKTGVKNIRNIDDVIKVRIANAKVYSKFLQAKNKQFVEEQEFKNHSFLKYPLLVNNRERFLELAEKNKIDIGEWFNSPLHPIQGDLSSWDLIKENFPESNRLAKQMVNLPTDTKDTKQIISFLDNVIDLII